LKDDLEYLEKISASTALGMMTGVIKARKELVKSICNLESDFEI
jgi:hypothetical protein